VEGEEVSGDGVHRLRRREEEEEDEE